MAEPRTLATLQRRFLADLRTGREKTATLVRGDERGSAQRRLGVYVHMYRARLLEVLREVYPSLARVAGDQAFDELCTAYVAKHPSRHPSLRPMGDQLAAWLRRRRPAGASWWGDLAALEWARYDVFDEADAVPLSLPSLRPLALMPAVRTVAVDHDVEAVWRGLQDDRGWERPSRRPGLLLVWRQGRAVYHRRLTALETAAWPSLAAGTTVAELCERLAASCQVSAEAVVSALSRWATDEILVAA
jgi:hypothetical protein